MSRLTKLARRKLIGERPADWQIYHDLLSRQLHAGMTVLEVGCGRGTVAPFPWSGHPGIRLVGADPDPSARASPHLDEFVWLRDGGEWPLPSAGFDLVVARYVLEHVAQPWGFLGNVRRVLKPGGRFLFLTPNRLHPAMMASRLLPLSWKRRILKSTSGVCPEQVFASHYRMNSPGRVRDLSAECGFVVEELTTRELAPSSYLDFSMAGFGLASVYFAAVALTGWERYCGAHIIGRLRRTGAEPAGTVANPPP